MLGTQKPLFTNVTHFSASPVLKATHSRVCFRKRRIFCERSRCMWFQAAFDKRRRDLGVQWAEIALERMMPGDLRQRSLGWECHDERALGNSDMRGQAMPELVTDSVDLGAGHEHVVYLVFQSFFANADGSVGMREDGDHATRFDIVCCEVEISIAYRRHNGIIAMQKTDGAMIGEQCHQLDVGYRMVDSPSERAVDMEKPRTVKPSDFEGG